MGFDDLLKDFYYSKNDDGDLIQNMVFEHMDSNLEVILKHHILLNKYIDESTLVLYMH